MKKLIIICEERLRLYGDFLAQLISSSNDTDGRIIGLRDGSAAAQVWTEKEYAANAPQISSEQYMLFIGNSKLFKDKRYHMPLKFSQYGMNYGWLGKQAVAFVDHSLSPQEYENFYPLATEQNITTNQPPVVKLLSAKSEQDASINEQIEDSTAPIPAVITEEAVPVTTNKGKLSKLLSSFEPAAKNIFKKTANAGINAFNKVSDTINVAAKAKEVEDQQYTCLILILYLNHLSSFLGISGA